MSTITSLGIGSGLDLNGLLDQLREAGRSRLEPLENQREAQQAKLSAYGTLQGALSTLRDAARRLDSSQLFQSLSPSVTGSSVVATSGSGAEPGRYEVDVSNLARSQSIATGGFAEGETFSAGELTIATANGDPLKVAVAEGATLQEVRDAINAAGSDITATLVNDGDASNPWRLVLTANDTGTEAAIQSITFSGGDDRLSFDQKPDGGYPPEYSGMQEKVAAENANLTVNGISITSQGNRVEGAIQGVTLNLEEEGASTVEVQRDNFPVRDAINAFVEAFNAFQTTKNELTVFTGDTSTAGELLGDSTLRAIESRLGSALGYAPGGTDLRRLSDIGISLQTDGTLELDAAALDKAVTGQRDALTRFFSGDDDTDGFAGRMNDVLGQIIDSRGLLSGAQSGLESRLESLGERASRMEASLEREIDRYRDQFQRLDAMIAQMNQTSSFLTQQFDYLNAALGRD